MDRLETMFNMQYNLQQKLGTWEKINNGRAAPPIMLQQFTNQCILALVEESIEIMRETPYKSPFFTDFGWKEKQTYNREAMIGEIVDLWHFVLNLSLAHGFNEDDFYREYCKKHGINEERKDNGY